MCAAAGGGLRCVIGVWVIPERDTVQASIARTEANIRLMHMMPFTCRFRKLDLTREIARLDEMKLIIARMGNGK